MTEDLPTRLLAAIEAKEAKARAATPSPWTLYDRGVGWEIPELPDVHDGLTFAKADAEYVADNEPAVVLAMCSAHREIVEQYDRTVSAQWNFATQKRADPRNEYANAQHLKASDEASALLSVLHALARGYVLQEGS